MAYASLFVFVSMKLAESARSARHYYAGMMLERRRWRLRDSPRRRRGARRARSEAAARVGRSIAATGLLALELRQRRPRAFEAGDAPRLDGQARQSMRRLSCLRLCMISAARIFASTGFGGFQARGDGDERRRRGFHIMRRFDMPHDARFSRDEVAWR